MTELVRGLPHPADFRPPPGVADRTRWREADLAARPARIAALRSRLATEGLDAYFGLSSENARYLTGFALADGEDKVAGHSGKFLVAGDEVVLLADSRYRLKAEQQAPETRIAATTYDLAALWPELMKSSGARRVGVEAALMSHKLWQELAAAAPDVEMVEVSGWIEAQRAVKEPCEVERIKSAAAVADRALSSIIRHIRPGRTERDLALALEWEIRTGGAEALAFDVACLAGPNAALPHGSPGEAEVRVGQVLLFDFGAMVDGYRSDMTRTLFVGNPGQIEAEIYAIVAEAQQATMTLLREALAGRAASRAGSVPSGKEADAAARGVIEAAGYGENFGHGTGHGIGLATHEQPSLSRAASDDPLPSPTVFSVEPGIYLDGKTGVRIEDLVLFDRSRPEIEVLTCFPRDRVVVGV